MTVTPMPQTQARVTVAEFARYEDAERAVDHLSDQRFPVEQLTIIGCELHLIEQVTGRLSWGRAALMGLGSGAWFGLFVGLLFAVFAESASGGLALILGGAGFGAMFGTVFALIAYALTGGRHDYLSRSAIVPARFELLADAAVADRARATLPGTSWTGSQG
jgi:hypothetical protein